MKAKSDRTMSAKSQSVPELIKVVREGTEHLVKMARSLEFPWAPTHDDLRKLHNMYARNLITSYVSKFADLSTGVLHAIEHQNFLMYALCARALIENTAILRYHVTKEYKPLLDERHLSTPDMQRLLEIDDQHLRGGKFDWESFLFRNYSKLKEDAIAKIKGKRDKTTRSAGGIAVPQQVRIGKCMEVWAEETPEILIAYNLFCDLVHPNIGSTFLVASTSADALYFSRFRGEPVGNAIVEQSFPILVSVTFKPFGQYLTLLMGTVWHDDELPTETHAA